jgi:hypothetical protein
MKPLSEALGAMPAILSKPKAMPPTPAPGSTSSGGRSITTQPLPPARHLPATVLRETPATPPAVPATSARILSAAATPPHWRTVPIRESREAQNQLTLLLAQSYSAQTTFSDRAQELENRDAIFQRALEDLPFCWIEQAFIDHIRESPRLPTPHDIYSRIVPSAEKENP